MNDSSDIHAYLRAAEAAERDSLVEHKSLLAFAGELDQHFRTLVTGRAYCSHPAIALLGMNAHASYLAVLSTALRGQSPPTFMVVRGCIESASYAFLIGDDQSDGDVWVRREEEPQAVKARFTVNRAVQKLTSVDPNLGKLLKSSYDWTIEFGAHPNKRSILDHLREGDPHPEGHQFSLIYIHGSDSLAVLRCIAACIENGSMAIALLSHAMPSHPEGERVFAENRESILRFQKHMADEGYFTP
ncbi:MULTISPECIES: hypothetical protein [unclassified Bradyrhizobium]|uniref:hypothetical protein n=1 Tax=unclassified Bradyrhizobium TaxID=2631580 RepID=UPI0028E1B822|nr:MULTISPECIES: hypothetical protein [unclassified Bradyrhizobium]